ncbi:MAG: hypothetical protein ACR2PA_17280 [Hyphomicrobiaceae bacterium]
MLYRMHLALVVLLPGLPVIASAQTVGGARSTVCVTCDGPRANYRCTVDAAQQHEVFLTNTELIRLACIKDIADAKGHTGCRAAKNQPPICEGQPFAVNLTDMAHQYIRKIPVTPNRQSSARPQPPPKTEEADEPKTVVDLAKQTAKQTQEQIVGAGEAVKNAGKLVGGTVEKSWRCLTSLFQDC